MGGESPLLAEALDLQPVGTLPPETLTTLAARLSRRIRLPCHVRAGTDLVPPRIAGRGQIDAGALLPLVEACLDARQAGAAPGGAPRLLVGVTAEDMAIPIFTFVFGLARQGSRACIVSLARTDPVFYGLPPDGDLRDRRAVAEILHELGHLAGLDHCPDRGCLMSFAGSIEKVDARGARFCPACLTRTPVWLRPRTDAAGPL